MKEVLPTPGSPTTITFKSIESRLGQDHLECELLGCNYTGRLSMESYNCLTRTPSLLVLDNAVRKMMVRFSIFASEEEDVEDGRFF